MEIAQNVCNELLTKNETLTSFLAIPMSFVESFLSMLLFTSILKINYTKKQALLYVSLLSLIAILNTFFIPSPYNTLVNIIFFPLLVFFIFKTTILKSILSEIITYFIFVVLTLGVNQLFTLIFGLSTEELTFIPLCRISCCFIIYSLVLILYSLIFHRCYIFSFFQDIRNNKYIIINLIIGILTIAIQYFIILTYIDLLNPITVFMMLFIIFACFAFNMYSLIRTIKLDNTAVSLEEQKLYNKTLTILYDNVRGFKHDFNNIVQSIGGYVCSNNIDGLKKYYSELLKDCQIVNNLTILSPDVINNPAIHSILTAKYHQADEMGIKFNLEAFLDLTTIQTNIYELTKILGILLDNAIEASNSSIEKIINVVIRKDHKANKSLFIIENTYSNKNLDINKIFEKGYTSKKENNAINHGIGLWEVKKLIKKNIKLNLYTSKDNMFFRQQLEIYN